MYENLNKYSVQGCRFLLRHPSALQIVLENRDKPLRELAELFHDAGISRSGRAYSVPVVHNVVAFVDFMSRIKDPDSRSV